MKIYLSFIDINKILFFISSRIEMTKKGNYENRGKEKISSPWGACTD